MEESAQNPTPEYIPAENYPTPTPYTDTNISWWRKIPVLISFLLGVATFYGPSYLIAFLYSLSNPSDAGWGIVGLSVVASGFGFGMMFFYYYLLTRHSETVADVPEHARVEKALMLILGLMIAAAYYYVGMFHSDLLVQNFLGSDGGITSTIFMGFSLSLMVLMPSILMRNSGWIKKVIQIVALFILGSVAPSLINFLLTR